MATFHQAQRRGFVRGATKIYTCRICGCLTRPTGTGDNDGVRLCVYCYDLAGEENSLSDTGDFYDKPEIVLQNIAAIKARGGDASCWDEIKAKAQAKVRA